MPLISNNLVLTIIAYLLCRTNLNIQLILSTPDDQERCFSLLCYFSIGFMIQDQFCNDNLKFLHILLGGTNLPGNNANHMRTTEFFNTESNSFEAGPLLPYEYGLIEHCLTWKDADVIMLVGGEYKSKEANIDRTLSSKVYEFHTRSNTFLEITNLTEAQHSPGCIVLDTASNGKEMIVAGGISIMYTIMYVV